MRGNRVDIIRLELRLRERRLLRMAGAKGIRSVGLVRDVQRAPSLRFERVVIIGIRIRGWWVAGRKRILDGSIERRFTDRSLGLRHGIAATFIDGLCHGFPTPLTRVSALVFTRDRWPRWPRTSYARAGRSNEDQPVADRAPFNAWPPMNRGPPPRDPARS